MQQAYTLKALITNTICADMSLRERGNHRRRRKGETPSPKKRRDTVAEERALLCATVGQIRATEPQKEHRRRRKGPFVRDSGQILATVNCAPKVGYNVKQYG